MIGFRMNDENTDKSTIKKPEIEVPNPAPLVVPSPEPDQIKSIPKPEIIEAPTERPSPEISEIGASEIMEI